MVEIEGKQFVCHQVKIHDTLQGVALKYNVSITIIKKANQLLTDSIFQKQELLIPVVPGLTVKVAEPESDSSRLLREEANRETALSMLNEHICKANHASKHADFRAEARFYLSENDFDYRRAAQAYDADLKTEQILNETRRKKK